MTPTPLRVRLRSETATLHQAVERRLDLPGRLQGRADAVAVLARLHGFLLTLEPALDALLGPAIMRGRHRITDLAQDLAALELDPAARSALPRDPIAGALDGPAAALGALYVIEGARLGGQVIGRAIAGRSWMPAGGLLFWPLAADPAPWRALLDLLDRAPDPDATVAGAVLTFQRLGEWAQPLEAKAGRCPEPREEPVAPGPPPAAGRNPVRAPLAPDQPPR